MSDIYSLRELQTEDISKLIVSIPIDGQLVHSTAYFLFFIWFAFVLAVIMLIAKWKILDMSVVEYNYDQTEVILVKENGQELEIPAPKNQQKKSAAEQNKLQDLENPQNKYLDKNQQQNQNLGKNIDLNKKESKSGQKDIELGEEKEVEHDVGSDEENADNEDQIGSNKKKNSEQQQQEGVNQDDIEFKIDGSGNKNKANEKSDSKNKDKNEQEQKNAGEVSNAGGQSQRKNRFSKKDSQQQNQNSGKKDNKNQKEDPKNNKKQDPKKKDEKANQQQPKQEADPNAEKKIVSIMRYLCKFTDAYLDQFLVNFTIGIYLILNFGFYGFAAAFSSLALICFFVFNFMEIAVEKSKFLLLVYHVMLVALYIAYWIFDQSFTNIGENEVQLDLS